MDVIDMSGDTVLVLGLGDSGLAMARHCGRAGARLMVWDSRFAADGVPDGVPDRAPDAGAPPPHAETLQREWPAAEVRGGALGAHSLEGVSRVLKSPGLSPLDARIAPLLQAAKARGVPVQGELDLFVQALAALKATQGYAPRLLAVTGTNGKTTTTAMTALLVERAGRSVRAAGNIGPTLLDTLAEASAEGELPEVWVLELSSFQLEDGGAGGLGGLGGLGGDGGLGGVGGASGVGGFEPAAATVLNLSEDHLDWHGTLDAYVASKARVFAGRGTMVLNRDDARVAALAPPPPTAAPTGRTRAPRVAPRRVVTFGLDAPRRAGDFGLVVENGMAWLVRALPADETAKPPPGEAPELHLQRLMPADALRVRGRHNAANALAALALATAIDCPLAPMLHGLREYGGEPHRVQWVATIDEVEAYDDSKGTNVGATVAALHGLGADRAPARLVLILGGDGKGQDFVPLAAPVVQHARAVATIGRDAAAIEAALADAVAAGLPLARHATLPEAVRWCFAQARPGDAVLLSPACASLDMFRNYGHRAEVFVEAVSALAAERGLV